MDFFFIFFGPLVEVISLEGRARVGATIVDDDIQSGNYKMASEGDSDGLLRLFTVVERHMAKVELEALH
jgi:hypothetical protein